MTATLPPTIGQLDDPQRESLPEGKEWRLSARGVELVLSMPEPTPMEIDSVSGRRGGALFAAIEQPNVLLMLAKVGDSHWFESSGGRCVSAICIPTARSGCPGRAAAGIC